MLTNSDFSIKQKENMQICVGRVYQNSLIYLAVEKPD